MLYIGDSLRTDTLDNAGGTVSWKKLELQFEVNRETLLRDEKFHVIAMDENLTRGDVVLGKGELSIRKLISNIGTNTKLKIDLTNEVGGISGSVEIVCCLRKASIDEVVEAIPDNLITVENGILSFKRIELKNLKGAENILGKKDPYVVLKIENTYQTQTAPQNNAGSNAVWDKIEDKSTPITGDILKYKNLQVDVFDKNLISDSKLATGECSMRKVGVSVGKLCDMNIILKDAKGKKMGNLIISGLVEKVDVVPAGEVGTLKIASITLKNIRNSTLGGLSAQSVGVLFQLGSFKQYTPINSKFTMKLHLIHCEFKVMFHFPLLLIPN